jgi:hypothetical protein
LLLSFTTCALKMAAISPNQYEAGDLEGANGDPIEKGKEQQPGTTNDAVFGEVTEDGPNYRGVCTLTVIVTATTPKADMT